MPIISGSGGAGGKISGVTVTGVAASGDVPVASGATAGVWAFPPGFEIGYDQITSAVNIASTTEATGTTIITCAAHTFDGSPVVATFFTPQLATGTTSASSIVVSLFEAAAQLAELATIRTPSAQQFFTPVLTSYRFTPSAAAHTYTITAFATNLTGTPSIGAGAGGTGVNAPAFVRFTKV